MPKEKFIKNRDGLYVNTSNEARNKFTYYYREKFFNKFLSRFEFTGIDEQQKDLSSIARNGTHKRQRQG